MHAMIAAHTLKHLLAILKANLQTLKDPELEATKTLCLRQVERMNQFIGQILVPNEKHEAKTSSFNLNELLQEIIELTQPSRERSPIHIELFFSHLPKIHGNKEELFHAFLNLLTNALEACPQHATISIQTERRGNKVEVVIEDRGSGIDRNMFEHLFSPYYTTKQNGNGLGLVITREIIRDHGGDIEILSEPGEGTTIRIKLPICSIQPKGDKHDA